MDSAEFQKFLHGDRIKPESACTLEHAKHLDSLDSLKHFRSEFLIPSLNDLTNPSPETTSNLNDPSTPSLYLCGNSLGLQPRCLQPLLQSELSIWAARGVRGHFDHPSQPWTSAADSSLTHPMSRIVGALPSEVAIMATLTENIHFLFAAFYKPVPGKRTKIIIESKAFPSDHYAVESQIRWHGLKPEEEMICVATDKDGLTSTEEILRTVDRYADTAAVLWLSGLQYYTGQAFEMRKITEYAQAKGILVGWDLAHAAGNLELELHEWNVDFAAWCTYKYLSSGPGAIGALFVHDRHTSPSHPNYSPPPGATLQGWWGHDLSTRFTMDNKFSPAAGAMSFAISNPSLLSIVGLRASLSVFSKTTMSALRRKSLHLTAYLEHLLDKEVLDHQKERVWCMTPREPQHRGAMLSLRFKDPKEMEKVFAELEKRGVVVDERKPDVIRVAPAPMWNTYEECWKFVQIFKEIMA